MIATAATYEPHPLAALIPAMSEDEYTRLREDIAANGLLDSIVLHEGQILDGRHRLRACGDTQTEPSFVDYDGDSPAQFVLSHNLHRRHLSESQRAIVALDFLPHLEDDKRRKMAEVARTHGRGMDSPAPSGAPLSAGRRATEEAAELVDASARQVQRAKRVQEQAPELMPQVRDGTLTLGAADRFAQAKSNGQKPPKPEAGAVRPAVVRRVAEQAQGLSHAIDTLALRKSCARMTDDERSQALDSCKAGIKALNAMAKALGR